MYERGKPLSTLAKVIFGLIVAMSVGVAWLGFRGLQKEPHGPPRGSQTLPSQAAQGTLKTVPPETRPAP